VVEELPAAAGFLLGPGRPDQVDPELGEVGLEHRAAGGPRRDIEAVTRAAPVSALSSVERIFTTVVLPAPFESQHGGLTQRQSQARADSIRPLKRELRPDAPTRSG
jgi:hypothetical protein